MAAILFVSGVIVCGVATYRIYWIIRSYIAYREMVAAFEDYVTKLEQLKHSYRSYADALGAYADALHRMRMKTKQRTPQ